MKAKAALSDGRGNFFFDEIDIADPGENEVRVRIKASGVCHTDWDTMRCGRTIILGHEGAGVVDRVGRGVTPVREGDRVLLNWAIPCGECFQCRRGGENICEKRPQVPRERFTHKGANVDPSFRLGTMSELSLVPKQAVIPIPRDISIPYASACIIGCGVMTGVGSVLNAARVAEGSAVAVIGTGGVGLSVIQGARIARAERIIAVDVNPERLLLATRFGATHTIPADRSDAGLLEAASRVKELTGGRGADYAFECTAVPQLGSAPLAMVRNGGTAVGVSGIEQPISFNMELFEWDKTYINPLYGQCRPARDFPRLLEFYRDGLLNLDDMVTRTYRLDELGTAYDDMREGRNAKGVLLMDTPDESSHGCDSQ